MREIDGQERIDGGAHLGRQSKEEIAARPLHKSREKKAFLSALIFSAGSLVIHGSDVAVELTTANEALVPVVTALAAEVAGKACSVRRKQKTALIRICDARTLLTACRVFDEKDGEITVCEHIAPEFIGDRGAATAYVRGAYLGAGSLSAGKQYHLEFSFGRKTLADDFAALLGSLGFSVKQAVRKGRAVVYTKESQGISDCLALMGATKAMLRLNSLLAARQFSEHLNRQQNCDMYNIDRQIDTGLKQCAYLKELDLDALSPPLREAALARLQNPDLSYEQLGTLLGIGKSGVKNRLRRLKERYDRTKTPKG